MSDSKPYPFSPLEDLVEVLDHLRAPVNSEERSLRPGTVPYYGATGLQGWIDKALTNEPLILLAEDGGNFDAFADRPIAYRIDGPAWVNNHAHIIRAKPGVSQSFVFWSIAHKDIRRFIAGGTRTKLTQSEMRRIEVPSPDPTDQVQIAAVLDTLDTTIRQTEAIIEKLKQVKQGLLHDLLTRGIDANGELRPPQSEAPHLYKASSLGWIPKDWADPTIRQVVAEVANGASIRVDEFRSAGTPVIAKGDVTSAKYIDTSRRIQFVEPSLATSKYKGSMINREFVVCSMRDLVPSAPTLGMASLLDADLDGLLAQGTTALLLEKDRFHAELFVEVTRLPWFRTKMRALAVGSTQVHMRGRDYLDVAIPAPPIEEQHEIVERVRTVDQSEEAHYESVKTFKALKSGLMDDLLTGRVRVTPLLKQGATA
ncbi:restriction endonuclease subunit S [Aquabacterium sp.]|uniref:restriction endonuclease subunit S n=1 Tax=Aquabacterium sp. TaxID=1872578 RepID=UPI003BB19BC0